MKSSGLNFVIPIPTNIHDSRSIPEIHLFIFKDLFEEIGYNRTYLQI